MVCRESAPGAQAVAPALCARQGTKAAGMDWTEVLAAEEDNPRSRLVTETPGKPRLR